MIPKLAVCLIGTLCFAELAVAQTPPENRPTPQSSQQGAPIQAGDPGPTDPATGMAKRENYDAQLNSGATDNSTGAPAGSDEQKPR
ncbi:MAG: hypothetical protein JWN07_842 [Hyphomicrobiales bacterium]|nr:hypothetical protein [Hyphomicrobiales bacterium]